MEKREKVPYLEGGLLSAMHAIDQQIARAMERSPAEKEEKGVQKWGPYQDKIEQVSSLLLGAIGDKKVTLDSLLVLSQALVKSLKLVMHDLGAEGLGKLRSSYCEAALEGVARDAREALAEIQDPSGAGFLT